MAFYKRMKDGQWHGGLKPQLLLCPERRCGHRYDLIGMREHLRAIHVWPEQKLQAWMEAQWSAR